MILILFFNLIAILFVLFFSDEFSDRGKATLVFLFFAFWLIPGTLITEHTPANVFFIVTQLAMALYLSFRLGVGHRRAYT